MSAPHIHARRRTFSASNAVEVQVGVLREIKRTDNLTYADLGRYLGGKSDDRARVYAPGEDSETPPSAMAERATVAAATSLMDQGYLVDVRCPDARFKDWNDQMMGRER